MYYEIQWDFIHPQRKMKYCHLQVMELENIILTEISQVQKAKSIEYRSNTHTEIL
jgi:hypothetical protein